MEKLVRAKPKSVDLLSNKYTCCKPCKEHIQNFGVMILDISEIAYFNLTTCKYCGDKKDDSSNPYARDVADNLFVPLDALDLDEGVI
jgi:hypothetical protein